MDKLVIVFERTVNKGLGDEKDKKSSKGEIVKGTPGEHKEEWHCKMTDKLGWPIAGHTAAYFSRKAKEGLRPIRIEGMGKVPSGWTKDMTRRVMEAVEYCKPYIDMRQENSANQGKLENGSPKGGTEGKGARKP